MITLFHWDLPDELDKRYGGLLNKTEFVADYTRYARVMFTAMGSKVKHWITLNEPWCSSILGYSTGKFAPGHTSDRKKSPVGDSSRDPWIVGHNLLVAHGSAVKVYREEFKAKDGGEIGVTLNGEFISFCFAFYLLISLKVTSPSHGTRHRKKTLKPVNGNSSSALPGSPIRSTTATTQQACYLNLEIAFPTGPLKTSLSSKVAMTFMV